MNKELLSLFFTHLSFAPHLCRTINRKSKQLGQKWKTLSFAETEVIVCIKDIILKCDTKMGGNS